MTKQKLEKYIHKAMEKVHTLRTETGRAEIRAHLAMQIQRNIEETAELKDSQLRAYNRPSPYSGDGLNAFRVEGILPDIRKNLAYSLGDWNFAYIEQKEKEWPSCYKGDNSLLFSLWCRARREAIDYMATDLVRRINERTLTEGEYRFFSNSLPEELFNHALALYLPNAEPLSKMLLEEVGESEKTDYQGLNNKMLELDRKRLQLDRKRSGFTGWIGM